MEDVNRNFPFIAREHVLNHVLRELQRTRTIQADHVQFGIQIRLCKKSTDTNARIDAGDIDVSSYGLHPIPKLFDAVARRQVR